MGFGLNQDLLPVKGHFFLIFAAAAPVTPFLPILAKQLGISPFGVGIVFAVLPFGGMVGKPIAGWLADCLGQQRIVFLLALLFTGLFYFSIQLVSSIDGDFSATFECSQPQSLLKICNTIEEKKKVLDILKPGCLQKCEVSCQHLDEDRFEKDPCFHIQSPSPALLGLFEPSAWLYDGENTAAHHPQVLHGIQPYCP